MFKLARMIPAPASPNPTRSSDVIFSSVDSRSIISYSPKCVCMGGGESACGGEREGGRRRGRLGERVRGREGGVCTCVEGRREDEREWEEGVCVHMYTCVGKFVHKHLSQC